MSETYERLAQPFDWTFKDTRGGVELEYVTGEQVTSRLNEVLGVWGWSFRVLQHGINVEADEVWVLGEMTSTFDLPDGATRTVLRQQFGSQKIKRSRSSGAPLDIGFDLKGAGTDALKKCASLIGVGLWLSAKDAPQSRQQQARQAAASESSNGVAEDHAHLCDECGIELKETRFKDGTVWHPAQLAGYGRRKYGKTLCMDHYRSANEARKQAQFR